MSKYIPYLLLAVLTTAFIYKKCSDDEQIAILKQNNSALGDTLDVFRTDNSTLYEKLAYIEAIHDSDQVKIDSLQLETSILTRQKIALEKIKVNNTGTVIHDTIRDECEGIVLEFRDSTDFYSFVDSIFVENPPRQIFEQSFNPFSISNHVGTDQNGLLTSVTELKGWARNWLKISDIETVIDESFYSHYARATRSSLSILPLGGIESDPVVYLKVGMGVKYNSDLVIYNYGTRGSHTILYGKEFSLWR